MFHMYKIVIFQVEGGGGGGGRVDKNLDVA